jgi:UDP-N-acetylmuramyl pentapeptide phosphotransferase/UDP-N-acetylglucosamine-1-phosphate transferase
MPAIVPAVAIPPLLALVVAALAVGALLRSRAAALVLDRPNQRSLHAAPTPRIGGIGILAGIAVARTFIDIAVDPRVLIALGLLIAISLVDDLRSIGVVWRMLTHLAGAALAASVFVHDGHGFLAVLAATFAITWMTNLYNFMDGSDGLAGGMAAFGFGTYGIAALCANDLQFAAFNFSVAAAAAGFLIYNFPPARVFMGDAGAIPLGFLAAVCAIAGWQRSDWPLWFGVVVFSPFIVDATLTLARRLARGAKVWQAHREHYYQRLVQAGWGHRKTLLAEFALMTAMGVIALAGLRLDSAVQTGVLTAVVALYVLLIFMLERKLGPPSLQNA